MLISSASMISQHAKKRDRAAGFDDEIQSNTMDICHNNSDDIYGTANSDIVIENLLKLSLDLQNLKERDERESPDLRKMEMSMGSWRKRSGSSIWELPS